MQKQTCSKCNLVKWNYGTGTAGDGPEWECDDCATYHGYYDGKKALNTGCCIYNTATGQVRITEIRRDRRPVRAGEIYVGEMQMKEFVKKIEGIFHLPYL